jgi:nucleotide-binding universal stress UspA family protein
MTNVLIAVDGTERDRSLVRQVLGIFGEDASYLVVSVSDNPAVLGSVAVSTAAGSMFSTPYLSTYAEGLEATAERAEVVAEQVAASAGMTHAETVGEVGDPATVLIEVAEERGVDVIAIGATERSWFSRLLDPSVEAAVVTRAPCAVLVVRHLSE